MVAVLFDTLKAIARWQPGCGVIENVTETGHGEENALRIIEDKLREAGFAVGHVQADLAWFHQNCSRRRWARLSEL